MVEMINQLYSIISTVVEFFGEVHLYFAWLPEAVGRTIGVICLTALGFRIIGWGD